MSEVSGARPLLVQKDSGITIFWCNSTLAEKVSGVGGFWCKNLVGGLDSDDVCY